MKIFIDSIKYIKDIISSIGSSTDIWSIHKTLLGYNNVTYKHIHNSGRVYPADGTNITVTSSAIGSTYGTMVEVVPANTIPVTFDCHFANIVDISVNGTYVIQFWIVDEALTPITFLCEFSVSRTDNFSKSGEAIVQLPPIAGNSRVGARVLKGTDIEGSVTFNIHYHDYA